jgi:hypothetical protein
MVDGSALGVKLAADDRKRRPVTDIQGGDHFLDFGRGQHVDLDTGPALAVALHAHTGELTVAVGQGQQALLLDHQVPLELGTQTVPHGQAFLVEGKGLVGAFVRANHLGIAAGTTGPDIAPLQHRYALDVVIPGKVIGRGKAM